MKIAVRELSRIRQLWTFTAEPVWAWSPADRLCSRMDADNVKPALPLARTALVEQ